MTDKITITRKDGAYIVTIDGGSIECGTAAEVMSRVGAEMGMPYMKANKEVFDQYAAVKKERDELTAERDKYRSWWAEAYDENRQLKAAIVAWFLRAFKEGGVRDALS